MAFQLPNFLVLPAITITNENDPDHGEMNVARTDIATWNTQVLAQLMFLNPNHGYAGVLPANTAHNAGAPIKVARLAEFRTYMHGLFPIYALAYTTAAAALVAGAAPPAPAPAPRVRPPKTQLPTEFNGKSPTAARHFIQQCVNYIAITPFPDPETEIRWALQLLTGDAAPWRDEMLSGYQAVPVPANLNDWDDFVTAFRAWFMDPHEADKAMDRLMSHSVTQKTSVKVYNDLFNETLVLANQTGANALIRRAYETGLKDPVRIAMVPLMLLNPNMTLHEHQQNAIRVDESLMQTRKASAPAPTRTVINNPVFNLPSPTPSRGTTPIKVEANRQYAKLTADERTELARIGGCFYCRQRGHMASQCPNRRPARVAAITPDETPAPDPASVPDPVPAAQDF